MPEKISFSCEQPSKAFDPAFNPKVISVISDIHINDFIKKHSVHFQKALNDSTDLDVDFFINAGDLVDNLESASDFASGHQYEPDGLLYQKLFKETKAHQNSIFTLDVEGNHDEFGLSSYDSPHHYSLNYTLYFNEVSRPDNQETFNVFTANIDNLTILSVNPYYYPTGRCRLGLFLTPTRSLLTLIEAEIQSIQKQSKTIDVFLTHYPVDYWDSVTSVNGKTFLDLVIQSKASVVITGHVHRSQINHFHHEGIHEISMPALKDHGRYALFTIDNDNYVSHPITTGSLPKGLITSPTPMEQFSKFTPFSRKAFEIRVLLFSQSTEDKVTAKIANQDNKVIFEKQLEYQRRIPYKHNQEIYTQLYSIPIDFSAFYSNDISQKFTLAVQASNGYEENITFYIGDSVKLPKEIKFKFPQLKTATWFFTCLLYCIFLFIVQPFFVPHIKIVDSDEKDLLSWIEVIFLGFVYLHYHFCKYLKKWYQYMMFAFVLISLILPHAFLSVDGYFSMIWNFGLVSKGKVRLDFTTTCSALVYVTVVLLPPILIACLRAQNLKFNLSLLPFIIYILVLYALDVLWVFLGMTVAAGPVGGPLSLAFVIFPLIVNVITCMRILNSEAPSDSTYRGSDITKEMVLIP